MKICLHLWQYLAEFFLEWKMFQTIVVEKIKTQVLYSVTFFSPRKSFRLWDSVEKYARARKATGDNIIRRMRFARWIINAVDACSECVILCAFPQQQWLRSRASLLRYTYIACLVLFNKITGTHRCCCAPLFVAIIFGRFHLKHLINMGKFWTQYVIGCNEGICAVYCIVT